MDIKLLKKGIKVNGKYYPSFYNSSRNNIHGNATIYLRGYEPLPVEVHESLAVENNSDIYTDYFEKDRIRIAPENVLFNRVESLAA